MRVWRLVFLLILSLIFLWSNTNDLHQHSRIATLVLSIQEKQALLEPNAPNIATTPTSGVSLGNIPITLFMAPISTPTIREKPTLTEPEERLVAQSLASEEVTPPPLPPIEAEPGKSQEVWTSFYYCLRTVDMPDDGGGFCWTTSSGTVPHAPTPTKPGTAACPPEWDGRTFIIAGDALFEDGTTRKYLCEDHGRLITGNKIDIWFHTNGEGWAWPLGWRWNTIIWQD